MQQTTRHIAPVILAALLLGLPARAEATVICYEEGWGIGAGITGGLLGGLISPLIFEVSAARPEHYPYLLSTATSALVGAAAGGSSGLLLNAMDDSPSCGGALLTHVTLPALLGVVGATVMAWAWTGEQDAAEDAAPVTLVVEPTFGTGGGWDEVVGAAARLRWRF